MKALAQPLNYAQESAPLSGHNLKNEQQISYLDFALTNLMGRYGVIDDNLVGSNKQSMHSEHDQRDNSHEHDQRDNSQVEEQSGLELELSLVVKKARNIRSMDVWRGADVFCAAFVADGSNKGQSAGTSRSILGTGGRLFQTEIMRGTSEADWTWNEVKKHQEVHC